MLIRPHTFDDNDDHLTCNVVYDEIIKKAFSWTYAIIYHGKSNIHFVLACYYYVDEFT